MDIGIGLLILVGAIITVIVVSQIGKEIDESSESIVRAKMAVNDANLDMYWSILVPIPEVRERVRSRWEQRIVTADIPGMSPEEREEMGRDIAAACLDWLPYVIELESVDRRPRGHDVCSIDRHTGGGYPTWAVSDSTLVLAVEVLPTKFEIAVKNLTDSTLALMWDDAVFLDEDGHGIPLKHSGVSPADLQRSQLPTLIPRMGEHSDVLIPWRASIAELGELGDDLHFDADRVAVSQVPAAASLILPIRAGDSSITEYVLEFRALPKL